MSRTSLVVEDHADLRKLIRMTLEFEDYDIHEVASAPDALTAAQALAPELIVLDVMMPGEFDGLEACRRLRADDRYANTRIILLSARTQAGDVQAGMAAGADAYLLKPFSPLQLLKAIQSVDSHASRRP